MEEETMYLPFYQLCETGSSAEFLSCFRGEEFETKRMVLCHRVTPHSHKPHLLQSVHTTSSTLNVPIFICCLHGNLTKKPPSALKPKLLPGLFIIISPCDNIFHLFKFLLFLVFLSLFRLSVFV